MLTILLSIAILILSAVFHEYMHGWMADRLGDPTARNLGRLTLNPLAHLDLFGSLLIPAVLILSHSPFIFGYAKPVPFNPHYLRDQKWGIAKVAIAGPAANLVLAVGFGLVLRLIPVQSEFVVELLNTIVIINLVLMVFNLVPIPPLDGSKLILPFLPYEWRMKFLRLEPFGLIFVVLFLLVGIELVWTVVVFLYSLIVGTG